MNSKNTFGGMNRYEQTSLWQKTLAKQLEPDIYEKERDLLRVAFENFRENAKLLAAEISTILPEFSVHDISHLDALWDTAELVTKGNIELNPAEAFILGGSFLIHDLGMGLASFPNGIEELKKDPIWNDTVTALLKEKLNRPINENDLKKLDPYIEKFATEKVLRQLHARHAEKLALVSWKNNGKEFFLIENNNLRDSYGSIIGLLAHSHWWPVKELEGKLQGKRGAPGIFPQDWIVDPIKLACILRIADATQIDDRRAPSFLRAIRKPKGESAHHWNFQGKLYQPRLERNRLVYTSKSSFTLNEVKSWWLCHDTLQMIHNELQEVDSLLIDTSRERLQATGILGIEDPKRLSKLITVEGWQPIEAKIKVGNVASLVLSLGGKQLYGNNLVVPLRELIQNSSDAIRARRLLESENSSFGEIIVRFGKDEIGDFIEVEDNGIGMSQTVLTGPFLDFGNSFWGTSLMHDELPGLESKGFVSTGKYGIGFFSIFMWGEKVTISTKRYENGRNTTLILEFNNGVSDRPILKKAKENEFIKDGGTRIRVWLGNKEILGKMLHNKFSRENFTYEELIETLCPTIDCNISIEKNGKKKQLIKANDWITIEPQKLVKRIIGVNEFNKVIKSKDFPKNIFQNMSLLKEDDGSIVGRIFVFKEIRRIIDGEFRGVVTIGGFKSSGLTGLIGVLLGKSDRASREVGVPIITSKKLKKEINKQVELITKIDLNNKVQVECATVIKRFDCNTGSLKIVQHKSGILNYTELKNFIKQSSYNEFIVISDSSVSISTVPVDFLDNVFWVDMGWPGILQVYRNDVYVDWPEAKNYKYFHSLSLEGRIYEALSEVWNCSNDDIIRNSHISSDKNSYKAVVGKYNSKAISFDHVNIIRKPK